MTAYVSGDYSRALELFSNLAEQGNVKAQVQVGWMYRNGQGVPQDDNEALKWYRWAAENGSLDAQQRIAALEKGPDKTNR